MISHDFKLIFTHIPKCAGRSICDIFSQRFDHYTAEYYQDEYRKFFEEYQKFTIVRNPFDRMVSLYIYLTEHRRHSKERIMVAPDSIPGFAFWLKSNIAHYQGDFLMTSAEGARGTDGDMGSSFWFSSQKRRLSNIDGKIIIPNIFFLEDGTEKVEKYLQKITGVYAIMPHSNKSEYTDYRTFYNDELIELASNFPPIAEDCKAFNYRF